MSITVSLPACSYYVLMFKFINRDYVYNGIAAAVYLNTKLVGLVPHLVIRYSLKEFLNLLYSKISVKRLDMQAVVTSAKLQYVNQLNTDMFMLAHSC